MAVDLSKIKKHELYKEGYNDVWNAKPQSTWEQVQEIANNNIQKSNRSIWDDIGNAFQTMWRGLTSGTKNVPYYFANVQENNQQFVKDTEQQFLTNPKTSVDEKAKLNNIGINQIAVANSDGEAKEKFKKNLETAKNEKPETNLIKKSIADSIQEDQEVINQKQEEIENPVVKKVAEVAPSIGQMIPGMTLSAINPGAGALYFMSSSGGGYIKDALDRGMNDKEARLYGTLMGVMEGATEMIGVENLSKAGRAVKTLVKGTGKEIAKEGVKELGKTTIKTALKDYGIGIADNVIQESLMEPVQETIAGLVGGKDKANWNNMGQRMLQSGINGGLCSAIMGGANMGINSCVAVVDKINNGQTPTQQEMQTATKDVNKKVNVENLIIESTQQQINKYKQNATQNAEGNQIVTNLQNNLPQNTSNTPAEQQVQQTARQIEKVAQNGNMGQINANVQNQQQIDRTEAVNSLKQRAEKELTGSEKTEILDFLNNTPNIDESSIKSITGLINMARNDILNTDETYKTGRQQKYVKYMNKTNEYDSSVLQQAKEIVPANNQGRRTKEQWLQIAEQIGNNIADKSATEIEEIAYRTWQEERPASKESLNRQGKKYVQFTSDDWINTIYNTVKKIDSQNAQTISQSQQVNQEQNNQQLQETDFTQPTQPNIQNYQYIKSDNIKIDNLRQDASKCLDNSEQTHNFVNLLEKFIQDKDVEIRLDDTLVDNNGKVANGKYQNGVIRINPNSTRAGEFIAIHELTHAIGTKDMMNIVENYRKSNTEFDNSVKELLKNYNQTEITEEALADVSAQLFGTQEFINNLSQENPSLFKKIYNEIKYLWHQFRGYKNQNQFIGDLQYKWEQAYRSNKKLNKTTNYSINPDFINEYDNWDKVERTGSFLLGRASKALQSIGLEENDIVMDKSKILQIRNKHPEMADDIIKSIPTILEEPTLVLKSKAKIKNQNNRRVIFGEIKDTAGKPVLVALEINPAENKNNVDKIYKVASAYGKENLKVIQEWLNDESNILYIDKNKNRTISWLKELGLQLPVSFNTNSSNNIISQNEENINKNETSNQGSFSLPKNIENLVFNEEFYDQFKYEDRTKITENIEELKRQKEKLKPSENDLDWDKNFEINQKIRAIKKGYDNIYDMLIGEEKSRIIEDYKYNPGKYEKFLEDNNKKIEKEKKLQKEIEEATPLKRAQYKVIQENNPMFDDEHVGIRSPADIKTFDEIIDDEESFTWGDYTKEDAQKDLKRGKVVIYSSYPIKQGVFVSTSRIQAQEYAGGEGHKVYSKEVSLNRVAWINGDEGQYAKVENNKYSKNNESWQEYLDNNFKSKGTRTDLQAIRLPTKENIEKVNQNKNIPLSQNVQQESAQKEPNVPLSKKGELEKYNNYKKNIIKGKEKQINNLIAYKNDSIRNIENKIAEKQQKLEAKKNKDTNIASTIKVQIENLKAQKNKIENLYNEKIDKTNSKINKEKIELETRNMMKKSAREIIGAEIKPLTQDLTKYKDKKAGILFNRETAQRNIDDIVSDKELATAIKETIFDPIQKHQAQKNRDINSYYDKINKLELNKNRKYEYTPEGETKPIKVDEATLAQLLIEKKITNADLVKYGFNQKGIDKINKTANTFTEILDELYNQMNNEQVKFGYTPIGKIENYFPHFFENKPDSLLGKIASYIGIDITNKELPTEIAGRTDTFKPGKTWNSNTLKRRTNKTDYDALTAMEKYIQGATDIIYTTEDIQKLREYGRQIRYQYSDKGIQQQIDNITNNIELTQEAKDAGIEGIFKNTESELSNFVTWLDDYTNMLAGKKAFSDRNMERQIGRNLYSSMSGIESRIAANTIGGNLSVSLTNFAPLFQSMGTTNVGHVLTGMLQTAKNDIKGIVGNKDISFTDNSTFLTNRFETDSISRRTFSQKASDVLSIPMNAIDEFVSESIVRAKYLENIDKGMTEEKALDLADKYTAKLMADRSKGALPVVFNSKNPMSKLLTMFQVEPNNIVSNYFKDMPRDAGSKGQLVYQATKLMVASWAFNSLIMAVRGGNEVLPDPIRWISYLIKGILGDDDDEKEKAMKDLSESITGNVPFLSNLAGFIGMEDIGRVPISNAMPDVGNLVKLTDKEADSQYKKQLALKEISKPLLYLGLPAGGAQLKKTIEGITTVKEGGSYTKNKKGETILQFPVENPDLSDYLKGGIFGKYASDEAKEYTNRNFKSLNAKQTKMYKESGVPYKDLLDYIDKTSKEGSNKKEDKIKYIKDKNMSDEQKWGIYTNDILSDTEREKDGGSQLKDAEYIVSNGVEKGDFIEIYNKAQENNLDIPTAEEYKEMKQKGISLKNYVDYKVKIKRETEEKRKTGELKETQDLKNTEKTKILLNSNYSNSEKLAIYKEYVGTQDKKVQLIEKLDFPIEGYLDYKIHEFANDKDADGETISGTKRQKVAEYLQNIDENQLPVEYKKIIAKIENINDFDKDIVSFVQEKDLSFDDKKEILEIIGLKVDKNGRVQTTSMIPIKKFL